MGRIRRYRTALSRNRRSRGFGIHSPYAYDFVRNVLRERLPYYNYAYLNQLRDIIVTASARYPRHPRVMSYSHAKMLFRIANHFCPDTILQLGTNYGYSTASVMSASRKSRLHLYEPQLERYPIVAEVLQPFLDDIDCYNDLATALHDYDAARGDSRPFVVVGSLNEADYTPASDYLRDNVLNDEGVIILRNIARDKTMKRLWEDLKQATHYGHTYTNEQLAVIVAIPHLPPQHFFLWF